MKNNSWILWVVLAMVAIFCCCCTSLTLLTVTSEDFQDGFQKGYCESWAEQGRSPEQDPFDLCN